MAADAGLNEDFNISRRRRARRSPRSPGVIWEACGRDPEAFALEHLPTFEVDVVRRWPSVEKAKRLLGWEAQIGVDEGIARHGRLAAPELAPAT